MSFEAVLRELSKSEAAQVGSERPNWGRKPEIPPAKVAP